MKSLFGSKEQPMSIQILLVVFLLPSLLVTSNQVRSEVWEPLRYFVGSWEGTGNGQPGESKTEREYKFVLNGRFLQAQNRSIYAPQPKNPKGEVHEEWSFLSYDRSRKQFVLRQFHVEGFVNEYVQTSSSADGKTFVFTTERIENIPAGWRARETYRILNADE